MRPPVFDIPGNPCLHFGERFIGQVAGIFGGPPHPQLPRAENLANLPNDYYKSLAEGKSDAWIKQFIEVRWGFSLKGKPVYRSFNPDIHVAARPLIYNPHLPLIMGFDAGLTPAATFGQLDPHGRLLVLAELTSENMGAKRFAN